MGMRWRGIDRAGDPGRAPIPHFDVSDGVWTSLRRRRLRILVVLALLALTVPDVPRRPLVVAAILINLGLTLLLERILPRRHRYTGWWSQLSVMVIAMAAIIPEIWSMSVMTVVAVSIWAGLSAGRRVVLLVIGPGLGALSLLALVYQPDLWILQIATSAALTILTWQIADGVRNQIAENEAVLERSLSATRSFVHMGELTSGRSTVVIGPIEDVLGWTTQEWVAHDILDILHPDDVENFWIEAEDAVPDFTIDRKARFRTSTGEYVWLRDVSQVLRDTDGRMYLRGFAMDVTAIEEANGALRKRRQRIH